MKKRAKKLTVTRNERERAMEKKFASTTYETVIQQSNLVNKKYETKQLSKGDGQHERQQLIDNEIGVVYILRLP